MDGIPSLYEWLNLERRPAKASEHDLEDIVGQGGEWRGRLLEVLLGAKRGDTLHYRVLSEDALLADGRVIKRRLSPPDPDPSRLSFFESVYKLLSDRLAKPWLPELSPCHPEPLEEVLERILGKTKESAHQKPQTLKPSGRGPWSRHLSAKETAWLDSATRNLLQPAELTVALTDVCWTLQDEPDPSKIILELLSSVMDGRAGHTDRWPIPLPKITLDQEDSDKDVRRSFRALACRLGQNGRLCPGYHSYFVMNLWERNSPEPADEGSFAPATEFVFELPTSTSTHNAEGILSKRPDVLEACRTIVYLALAEHNGRRTLHSVSQRLFKRRRPTLRLGPSSSPDWVIKPTRAWHENIGDDSVPRYVPSSIKIRIPHKATFARVLPYLTKLDQRLLEEFAQTIWPVMPGRFCGFPWDAHGLRRSEPDDPAFVGRAAGLLVEAIVQQVDDDLWKAVGHGQEDRASFSLALSGFLRDCGSAVVPEEDVDWMYKAILANSVFFDDDNREHRQVPVAIAEREPGRVFVAAGTYLMTQRRLSRVPEGHVERFRDMIGRFSSLQIAAHASRFVLSIAATRLGRQELETLQAVKQEQVRRQTSEERHRKGVEAARDVQIALRTARAAIRHLLESPMLLRDLWRAEGEPDGLYAITHTAYEAKPQQNVYEAAASRLRRLFDRVADQPLEGAAGLLIPSIATAVLDLGAASTREAFAESRTRFYAFFRAWNKDENSIPQRLATCFASKRLIADGAIEVAGDPSLPYAAIPAAWYDPLHKTLINAKEASGDRVKLWAFVSKHSGASGDVDNVTAGFVVQNVLEEFLDRQTDKLPELAAKMTNEYATPWMDFAVVMHGNADAIDPLVPEVVRNRLTAFVPERGVSVVLIGKPVPVL